MNLMPIQSPMTVSENTNDIVDALQTCRLNLIGGFVPGQVVLVTEHRIGKVLYSNVKFRPQPKCDVDDDRPLRVMLAGTLALVVSISDGDGEFTPWLLLVSHFGLGWTDELEGLQIMIPANRCSS